MRLGRNKPEAVGPLGMVTVGSQHAWSDGKLEPPPHLADAPGWLLDWGERGLLFLLYAGFAASVLGEPNPVNLCLLATETVAVVFVLLRRAAFSTSQRPSHWAVAVGATFLTLLLRPGGDAVAAPLAVAMGVSGLVVVVAAKLSLNRRLGMAPANRGVQVRWSYAVVRHPMYGGYLVAQCGFLLQNLTLWNAMVLGLSGVLQVVRMVQEEAHLGADPAYRTYAGRVGYRLIPGVF